MNMPKKPETAAASSSQRVDVSAAQGAILNGLVAMALGHQLFLFDDWTHQVGKEKGRNPERLDQVIAFSPFRAKWVMFRENAGRREIVSIPDFESNANLSIPLLESAKIGISPEAIVVDDKVWRAALAHAIEIDGVKKHCPQFGATLLQAGLRCLVEAKLGRHVQVPAPWVGGVGHAQ